MKCAHYSDTHGCHYNLKYPTVEQGFDVMFHSGDMSPAGTYNQAMDFISHCNELVECGIFKHVVFTVGNHDKTFTDEENVEDFRRTCNSNVHLLLNESIEIDGFTIWGSPMTPKFSRWHFMYRRGEEASEIWSKMPDKLDILVTHGPPRRILDAVPEEKFTHSGTVRKINRYTGCVELMERVGIVKPAVHMFGHIHEENGHVIKGQTTFFNSSIMNQNYKPVNKPQAFEITKNGDGTNKVEVLFKTIS